MNWRTLPRRPKVHSFRFHAAHEVPRQFGVAPKGLYAVEPPPSDMSRFLAHALRDRFPADIEEQVERAWSD